MTVCPVDQKSVSGSFSAKREQTVRNYLIKGPTTRTAAIAELLAGTPVFDGTLIRRNHQVTERWQKNDGTSGLWDGKVTYSTFAPERVGDEVIRGSTAGSTEIRRVAIEHIADYAPPGATAQSNNGAINVSTGKNGQEVEGVEVGLPALSFSITRHFPPGTIDCNYVAVLYALSQHTNTKKWRCFEPGELLFEQAEFESGDLQKDTATFHFRASPNVQNLTVAGGITIAEKKGWHYVWYSFEKQVDAAAKRLVQTPSAAHVERVYFEGDLGLLGLPY